MWALGDASLLWEQDTTKPEEEVYEIVSLPQEWINLFINKNIIPGEGILLVTEKIKNWSQEGIITTLVTGSKIKSKKYAAKLYPDP